MLGGKNALINNPVDAIQQFYLGECKTGNTVDTRKLAELVREGVTDGTNAFPKFVEQLLEIDGVEIPDLSILPSVNLTKESDLLSLN